MMHRDKPFQQAVLPTEPAPRMVNGQVNWSPHPQLCIREGSGWSAAARGSHSEDPGGPDGCFLSPCSQAFGPRRGVSAGLSCSTELCTSLPTGWLVFSHPSAFIVL